MEELPILFPPYIGKKICRGLAALFPDFLLLESGERLGFTDEEELVSLLFSENLLTLVESVADLPDALIELAIEHGVVYCTKEGKPRSLKIKGPKNTTRWLIDLSAWGEEATLSLDFLKQLRKLFDLCKVGTPPTSGALGMALLKKNWRDLYGDDWPEHRHRRPPEGVCQELRARGTGARSEVEEEALGALIEQCIELDRKNSYGADLCEVPTGPTVRFLFGDVAEFACYVGECQVTIAEPLSYGLFPVRVGEERIYPTAPGRYTAWLWSPEITFLREQGLTVEVGAGYGWYQMTRDPETFVKLMEKLRDKHPDLADQIKGALVKTVGRLGMDNKSYQLTQGETDRQVSTNGRVYDWFVEEIIEINRNTMPHWFWYVLMQTRLALTKEALTWQKKEMLLATNTDAVYLSPVADMSLYVKATLKHSVNSGEWSWSTRNALPAQPMFPANRHLISREKRATPGRTWKKSDSS